VSAVLLIGGTDSSGGAGLVRDLCTATELGAPAVCAVTAVTAQTDGGVRAAEVVSAAVVRSQIEAAFATRDVGAVKIGMLATAAVVHAVAAGLAPHRQLPVVLDPVLLSTSGAELLDEGGRAALVECLLARATLLTPNLPEAAALLRSVSAISEAQALGQAQQLVALGARAVLLKGGHATGAHSVDLLVSGAGVERLSAPRVAATRRGTGCALSTAIAVYLAQRVDLPLACARAKTYVTTLLHKPP
jgi:hydroxymethylpyrimidine/phosphomethylpyrimidine kinase